MLQCDIHQNYFEKYKTDNNKCREVMQQLKLSYITGGSVKNGANNRENYLAASYKIKHTCPL